MLVESVLSCLAALRVFFQTRGDTALEIVAVRQQLAVLKRKRPRPQLDRLDRIFWIALRRCWARWTEALVIVKPETVAGWHRAGFRLYWRWRSHLGGGRPKIAEAVRILIRRLACRNSALSFPNVVSPAICGVFDGGVTLGNVGWRFCRITEKRLSPSTSSRFRRPSFNFCTVSS